MKAQLEIVGLPQGEVKRVSIPRAEREVLRPSLNRPLRGD